VKYDVPREGEVNIKILKSLRDAGYIYSSIKCNLHPDIYIQFIL
jgi:hypothetical protein